MMYTIDKTRCPQNHKCPMINICPVGAITQEGFGLPKIDPEICIKCGKCTKFCPMKAVYKQN